jgi:hypothetical protein
MNPALKGRIFLALVAATYVIGGKVDFRMNVAEARTATRMLARGDLNPRVPDRRRLASDPELSDELKATEFVRRRTTPSTRIFVSVQDHSIPFANDVRAYWLSERLPAVTYVNLDLALTSGERVQRDIISQLQKNHTEWAILYDAKGSLMQPWYDKQPPGSKALDDFLAAQFQEAARFGRYLVMNRNQSPQGEYQRANQPGDSLDARRAGGTILGPEATGGVRPFIPPASLQSGHREREGRSGAVSAWPVRARRIRRSG